MKRWTIYCHTHVESGRHYIGLTSHTMMHRWNQHCSQSKRLQGVKSHFVAAIRKYGKNAFSHKVLAMSLSLEDANATEQILIEQWDTRNPEVGFNFMKGGLHVPHPIRKNPWDDPVYRQKSIEAIRFAANSPSGRFYRAENGRKSTGRIVSDSTRNKISSASLKNVAVFNLNRYKGVPSDLARSRSIESHRRKHEDFLKNPSCKSHGLLSSDGFYLCRSRSRESDRVVCKECVRERGKRKRELRCQTTNT